MVKQQQQPEPQEQETQQPPVTLNSVPVASNEQKPDGGEHETQQPGSSEKLFTQADIDRMMNKRWGEEKDKDAELKDLRAKAKKLQEIEDAQKTEFEKLQERLGQLENQATQTAAENKRLKLNAKIASVAGQLGAVDPNDPNFVMATQAIDPDGNGADDQIKSAIEALKTQRPYLFGNRQSHLEPFNPEGGPGQRGETDAQKRARIYGSGGEIFDTEKAVKQGGGVIFVPGWDK